jgi:DnaJ-class molecular chaperone
MTSEDSAGGFTYQGVTYHSTGAPRQSATPLEICPDCAGTGELYSRICTGCNGRGMFVRIPIANSATP